MLPNTYRMHHRLLRRNQPRSHLCFWFRQSRFLKIKYIEQKLIMIYPWNIYISNYITQYYTQYTVNNTYQLFRKDKMARNLRKNLFVNLLDTDEMYPDYHKKYHKLLNIVSQIGMQFWPRLVWRIRHICNCCNAALPTSWRLNLKSKRH